MSKSGYTHGRFVWRELMTRDAAKARAFYGGLLGWTFEDVPHADGGSYTLIKLGGKEIGGLMQLRPEQGDQSFWLSYVSVPDVDAVVRMALEIGGSVAHSPTDIPHVGRFAAVQDFAGAVVVAYRDLQGDPPLEAPKPGEFCWETLGTPDLARAKAFYGRLFGWTTIKGLGGTEVGFSTDDSARGQVADIQVNKEFTPAWLPHVMVQKLTPACDRATELGGQIPVPLIAAPGLGRISLIEDPTGAHLALFEPARK
ncbi:VOC family protein [Hyalangium versicolor]|uniref:VOC family protein n=1 Tax=Hyalangium versicolor TaxID=2861190 RepID=UPI001CCC9CEC|nr:VOC family protein [Hyalangium versicolor]